MRMHRGGFSGAKGGNYEREKEGAAVAVWLFDVEERASKRRGWQAARRKVDAGSLTERAAVALRSLGRYAGCEFGTNCFWLLSLCAFVTVCGLLFTVEC